MEFRIANTFTDSLAKLNPQEQKAVKTTAFDLQLNPAKPGFNFHKIEKAKDENFFSVRVNRDIRLIVHKSRSGLLLCYVDHHDSAYRWARLRINYRTSHQIRKKADRLLAPEITDVDGITEERSGTISVFNGPQPVIEAFSTPREENRWVGEWLSGLSGEGIKPHEIGVFVRSGSELERAKAAVKSAGLSYKVLDEKVETGTGFVSICTMHLAKGLEFRAVSVMACDDEVIPLMERIEMAAEDSELEEVYNTERHLLYVACTRARDHLLVTGLEPVSEFLDDLGM